MDSITIKFRLKIENEKTGEKKILPLPHNDNIFEVLGHKYNDLYIVDKNGEATLVVAFITVVDANDKELV